MTRLFSFAFAAAMVGAVPPTPAVAPSPGEVTGVSVVSAPGRAEIVISVSGTVEVRDFILKEPARLVLDLKGATLHTRASGVYDGVNRGGVLNVRTGQYGEDVVRVVLELDDVKEYQISQKDGEVRVSFGAERPFLAWSSVSPRDMAAPKPASSRPAGRPEVAVRATAPADPADEPRITVTWDKASIADVVAGFAAFSGRSIILGKDIKGDVTAEVKNQPWSQAFYAVLATQGLSATELPGGIIRVDSPAALSALDSLEPLETQVVRMNYAKASEMANNISGMLTKGRGSVVPDTASNSLIVTDTRSRIQGITDFVRGLDIRTPLLAIQGKIIFVDRTSIEQLGLRYDLGSSTQFFNKLVQRTDPATGEPYEPEVTVVDLGGGVVSAIANADAEIRQSALELVFSTAIGGFDLTTFLSALEQTELADVQAEPLINTLDNREADILVGEETPVRIVDYSSTTGGNNAPRSTVQFKETGIRLTVTPHVTNDRNILLDLATERSSVQPVAAADLGFIIQTQRATNQLLVADGETAVIGGLTVTEVNRTRSGIPMLSRLPLIGALFSFTNNTESRQDLIILITPRIIDDGSGN